MKLKTSIEEIYAPVQSQLNQVDQAILDILTTSNPLSREVIEYFFSAKGKCLRPALCLLGASFSGKPDLMSKVIPIAGAFEVFHSATLIHDDIIDNSALRRGLPTVNVKWGSQVAVLVGDFLHDRALAAFFAADSGRLMKLFLNTACEVCDGEILEFREKNNTALSEALYTEIIDKKTASLFATCLEAGGILGELEERELAALREYGRNFGIAFQIVDDCLDLMGETNVFGKTLGADIGAGVLTLPLIRLIEILPLEKKKEIQAVFTASDNPEKISLLKKMIAENETVEYSLNKARALADAARGQLSVLKDVPARQSLGMLLDFVLERSR